VDGGNGCFYGISRSARRVVEYRLEDKSMKEIGPDLRSMVVYRRGIRASNGNLYFMPFCVQYVLKIILIEGQDAKVQMIGAWHLPVDGTRVIGVLANDGCIYSLPYDGCRSILKLDPNDGDRLSIVGEEFGEMCYAAVLGNDGYIYGISAAKIMKYNLTDQSVSQVGRDFGYIVYGIEIASDGNIYSVTKTGQILKIDTANNDWRLLGGWIYQKQGWGWAPAVLGADKCLYFPPIRYDRVLKFNPATQEISLFGDSCGDEKWYWRGANLASDGFIYCVSNDDILQIDSRHINEQVIEMIDKVDTLLSFDAPSSPDIPGTTSTYHHMHIYRQQFSFWRH